MKQYHLEIHERVKEDIRRNAKWWSKNHSTEQARVWFDTAFIKLHTLTTFPESHPLADENDAFPYEIRNMLFGIGSRKTYRAVFTIKDDIVYVLCVQRGTEDSLQPNPDEPEPKREIFNFVVADVARLRAFDVLPQFHLPKSCDIGYRNPASFAQDIIDKILLTFLKNQIDNIYLTRNAGFRKDSTQQRS